MPNIVNALLLRQADILLVRRSPDRRAYPNLWSFPGGHVENGETLDEALCRETFEEIGVTPLNYSLVLRIVDTNEAADRAVFHLYAVRNWQGIPTIRNQEHTELRWFELSEAALLSSLAREEYRSLFAVLKAG